MLVANVVACCWKIICASLIFGESKLNRKFFTLVGFVGSLVFFIAPIYSTVAAEHADLTAQKRFVKFDAHGNRLPANATNWSCVNDLETNLFWVVSMPPFTHAAVERTFRWGGLTALEGRLGKYLGDNRRALARESSALALVFDDWSDLILNRRKTKLCGLDNWRVPSLYELNGLVSCESGKRADLDRGCGKKQKPFAFNTEYFPDTKKGYYWSSSPAGLTNTAHHAWAVHSTDGSDSPRYRGSQHYVRLVGSR